MCANFRSTIYQIYLGIDPPSPRLNLGRTRQMHAPEPLHERSRAAFKGPLPLRPPPRAPSPRISPWRHRPAELGEAAALLFAEFARRVEGVRAGEEARRLCDGRQEKDRRSHFLRWATGDWDPQGMVRATERRVQPCVWEGQKNPDRSSPK